MIVELHNDWCNSCQLKVFVANGFSGKHQDPLETNEYSIPSKSMLWKMIHFLFKMVTFQGTFVHLKIFGG